MSAGEENKMGVEIFKTAVEYQDWAQKKSVPDNVGIEVVSVLVFNDNLVVTWKYV